MSGPCLTYEERYQIHAGLMARLPIAVIAEGLGRHRSSLYDEIKRGGGRRYCPERAQRHRNARRARSAANGQRKPAAAWRQVGRQLSQGWSPEQISGRRTLLRDPVSISTPAIYAAVARFQWTARLYRARLRQHLKRPARRLWCGTAQSIHVRAQEVFARLHIGHWEADTAVGKKKDAQRLLVMVERQSLYMELVLLRRYEAELTGQAMARRLGRNGIAFTSVATDRGTEFTTTGKVFKEKAFACDPHAPNQRGTNENQIGMIRPDFPKGVSMDDLTPARVRRLQQKYNHRPRKSLGYLTPYEVAFNCPPLVGTRS